MEDAGRVEGPALTLEKEIDKILWMEEGGSGSRKEQLRSSCC